MAEAVPAKVRDYTTLYPELVECRVIKSQAEIALLAYVNAVSSDAHLAVMAGAKPGMAEFQLESTFLHHCYFHGGCRHVAYTSICACGPNNAVLHYGACVRVGGWVRCAADDWWFASIAFASGQLAVLAQRLSVMQCEHRQTYQRTLWRFLPFTPGHAAAPNDRVIGPNDMLLLGKTPTRQGNNK